MKTLTKKQRNVYWSNAMRAIDFDYPYLSDAELVRIERNARDLEDYLVRQLAFERSSLSDNGAHGYGVGREPQEIWEALTGVRESPAYWLYTTNAMSLFAEEAYAMVFIHIREGRACGKWVFSNKSERVSIAIAKYLFLIERLDRRFKRLIEFSPPKERPLIRRHIEDMGHSMRIIKLVTGDRIEAIKLLEGGEQVTREK